MKKLIFLLVLLTTASYGADYHSPYDPGAARNTLSNVTPATGRAALGLGTMAAEAATDYVATDTFTGHTGATGSAVHGLGTISTKADTDYVATSALALRLDTGNASFTSDIDVAGDVGAATVNGVAPLTAAEKTQALVGSSTVDFAAQTIKSATQTWTLPGGKKFNVDGFYQNIGAAGTYTLPGYVPALGRAGSIILIDRTSGYTARLSIYSTAIVEEYDPYDKFSTTKDTATSINIYTESNQLVVQNTRASAVDVQMTIHTTSD